MIGDNERDLEREMAVGRRLGFVLRVTQDSATLIWLDGEGALSRHQRGATEAEVRMWSMLVGIEYQPWSSADPASMVRNQLLLRHIGVPADLASEDRAGGPRERGGSGA